MPDPEFDPRRAALEYGARVQRAAESLPPDEDGTVARAIAAALNGLVCGLVYVGDQLAEQTKEFEAAYGLPKGVRHG